MTPHSFNIAAKILVIAIALLVGAGCESVAGTVIYDGETLMILNCEQDGDDVVLETDTDLDLVVADDSAKIGTGACVEEGWVGGGCFGVLGCVGRHWGCVQHDWTEFTSCVDLTITEGDYSQGGRPVLDVEAVLACENAAGATLTGTVTATGCNSG